MAQRSKKKYTSKHKRKAHDIEKGYKKRGVGTKKQSAAHGQPLTNQIRAAGRRAAEVAGKSGANRARAKVAEKAGGNNPLVRNIVLTPINTEPTFIDLVSFVQPWLLLFRERFAFISANARSFSFAVRLWRLS
jgi:hypothetical protein